MEKLRAGIEAAVANLNRDAETDRQVSEAIMTTDTRPKRFAVECDSENGSHQYALAVCVRARA